MNLSLLTREIKIKYNLQFSRIVIKRRGTEKIKLMNQSMTRNVLNLHK